MAVFGPSYSGPRKSKESVGPRLLDSIRCDVRVLSWLMSGWLRLAVQNFSNLLSGM